MTQLTIVSALTAHTCNRLTIIGLAKFHTTNCGAMDLHYLQSTCAACRATVVGLCMYVCAYVYKSLCSVLPKTYIIFKFKVYIRHHRVLHGILHTVHNVCTRYSLLLPSMLLNEVSMDRTILRCLT